MEVMAIQIKVMWDPYATLKTTNDQRVKRYRSFVGRIPILKVVISLIWY
jgi:hypothetical protein